MPSLENCTLKLHTHFRKETIHYIILQCTVTFRESRTTEDACFYPVPIVFHFMTEIGTTSPQGTNSTVSPVVSRFHCTGIYIHLLLVSLFVQGELSLLLYQMRIVHHMHICMCILTSSHNTHKQVATCQFTRMERYTHITSIESDTHKRRNVHFILTSPHNTHLSTGSHLPIHIRHTVCTIKSQTKK